MNPAISVLVPVYNVEKTLDRCVQSILNQTFQDYEILLINDGSPDKSGELCDRYAEQYPNIRVIHKENEGLGPTRNRGIREAKGEFIYHCDSDDWLKEDLLEKAYNAIIADDSDVLVFGYEIFTEKEGKILPYDKVTLPAGSLKGRENVRAYFTEQYYNSFSVLSACNRLYRRSFLLDNNVFFPPLRRCQDMAYSLDLFGKVEKLTVLSECYYCYMIEPGVFKGRSFWEMLETYMTVHTLTANAFSGWGQFASQQKEKLTNRTCEHIANYVSYALIVKYPEQWKENAEALVADQETTALFAAYTGTSRFMRLFSYGVTHKRVRLLKWVSKQQQAKVRKNNR